MSESFVDAAQLDFSNPAVREVRSVLSDFYYRSADVIALVRESGGKLSLVNWDQPMDLVWYDVLVKMSNQGKLRALMDRLIEGNIEAVAVRLKELTAAQPVVSAPLPHSDGLNWPEAPGGFEKITAGESTLLDIAFLHRGVELAPAVVRLYVVLDGDPFHGTAFRIGENLFLTNHHVLFAASGKPAMSVDAWFGYERTFGGATKAHISVGGNVSTIIGDAEHDWAVIRLDGPVPPNLPILDLRSGATVKPDDRVYIIQHPAGGPKQIGMIHNVVKSVDEDVITYWTDTKEGSSGSPVFNEQWQVVGLHHYWVSYKTATTTEIRNQGRRIERVVAGLMAKSVSVER